MINWLKITFPLDLVLGLTIFFLIQFISNYIVSKIRHTLCSIYEIKQLLHFFKKKFDNLNNDQTIYLIEQNYTKK